MINKLIASVFLMLVFLLPVFAGETGNGGRFCDPSTQQCTAVNQDSTSTLKTILFAVFSQIVGVVK